jgi:hypothetical protein
MTDTLPKKQYGALLVFKPGTGKDKAAEALRRLVAEGLIDMDYYGGALGPTVQTFNPNYGGPVWYIP